MILQKYLQSFVILAAVIAPAAESLALLPKPSTVAPNPQLQISVGFPPPDGPQRSRVGSTVGGGKRGGICTQKNQTPLTALMPSDHVGTTFTHNPTLFWYVPETTAKSAEVVVVDRKGNYVYSQEFNLPNNPGVVKLSLPDTVFLEPDQSYWWEFAIICDALDRGNDVYVWGALKRPRLEDEIKIKLENELQQTEEPLQKAEIYARYRIWSETIAIVAQLRDSNPREWQELLNSVGIEEQKIIEAPVIDAVTREN